MSDLAALLQSALGTGYEVRRELGGGGMARVFVVADKALARQIVVKVLPPEQSAAVSSERFRREIQLLAGLQHPNIVPLLAAGESHGLLYFTMPFVEGQSLRQRLNGRSLGEGEAVALLREMLDALAYAHEHGVTHRDIKPDNILLSGPHALITDFGVAKAVRDASATGTLTGIGISLGTPAYMAPEQALADPGTDHRADIYALGCVGYEMLAGAPPFAGSAQQVMSAHVTETPVDLSVRAPQVGAALRALIMKCLAKQPEDRWQSARGMLARLDAIRGLPVTEQMRADGAPARPHGRRKQALWAVSALILAALGVVVIRAAQHRTTSRPSLVAIAPFRVSSPDSTIAYLGEGMVDLLTASLGGEGGMRAVDPRTMLAAWKSARQGTSDPPLDDALRIATKAGASRLVLGEVVGSAPHLSVSARLLATRDGHEVARASAQGPNDSLPSLVNQLSAELLSLGAGENSGRVQSFTSTSLPAIKVFLEGQRTFREGRYQDAANLFQHAVELDSTFALAAIQMGHAVAWTPLQDARVQRGFDLAWRRRERLSPRDRAWLEAYLGPHYPEPSSFAERREAAERLVNAASDMPDAWTLYSDNLFHRSALLGHFDEDRKTLAALLRAFELDSSATEQLQHAIDLAGKLGDTATVRRVYQWYLVHDTSGDVSHYVRWRAAQVFQDSAELHRWWSRIDSLSENVLGELLIRSQDAGADVGVGDRIVASLHARVIADNRRRPLLLILHDYALNRGRPSEAAALLRELEPIGTDSHEADRLRVFDALYSDGDTLIAKRAVAVLDRTGPPLPTTPAAQLAAISDACVAAQWRVARGGVAPVQLALMRSPQLSGRSRPLAETCEALVMATVAVRDHAANRNAALSRIDSLLRTGPATSNDYLSSFNIAVSSLYEREGNSAAALDAARRRQFWGPRTPALESESFWQQAHAAAAAGERELAIAALRGYVTLRSNPEPSLIAPRDEARRMLASLVRGEPTGAAKR